MESERKGRKDGESERGVVYHQRRKERACFTTELQRRKEKSHAPRTNKSSETPL